MRYNGLKHTMSCKAFGWCVVLSGYLQNSLKSCPIKLRDLKLWYTNPGLLCFSCLLENEGEGVLKNHNSQYCLAPSLTGVLWTASQKVTFPSSGHAHMKEILINKTSSNKMQGHSMAFGKARSPDVRFTWPLQIIFILLNSHCASIQL